MSNFYKIFISLFLCALVSTLQAQLFQPEGLNLPGQWNNWTNPPLQGSVFGSEGQVNGEVKLIDFGLRRYSTTLHCAEDGDFPAGSYNFLITSGPEANPYQNKWANVNVTPNALQSAILQGINDNLIEAEDNTFYTFNFRDNGYQSTEVTFLQTSQRPSEFTTISPFDALQNPDAAVNITASLDVIPSGDQYFYLQYSVDAFASSSLISLLVNGTTVSGTIPGVPENTTVQFYIFSSPLTGFSNTEYDMFILRFLTNNGQYFSYSTGEEEPTLEDFTVNLNICSENEQITLDAGEAYETYLWSTGETTSSIEIIGSGIYTVTVGLNNQTATGTFNVNLVNSFFVDLGENISQCGTSPVTLSFTSDLQNLADTVTIRYDATQGQTGLVGATKVYYHSGIAFTPGGPWSNGVGNWEQDDGIGEMYSVGENLWEIKINPQTYYNLNPGQTWAGFWMVFRNADGTAEGKDDNGGDIYLNAVGNPPYSSLFTGVTGSFQPADIQSILWSNGENGTTITVNESGTYSVTVTNTGGCTVTAAVEVNFIAVPVIDLGENIAICADIFNIILDAGEGFETYLWSNGADSPAIVVNNYGTFSVIGTTSEGCTATDQITISSNIFEDAIDLGLDRFICGNGEVTLNSGIYFSPQGDSLTIVYDATQGQTGLVGANKVYMHSGYELEPFGGPVGEFVGNWEQDDGIGEMSPLGNDLWTITIFPPAYYGFEVGTPINGLLMVFRNADGTAEGKDENGNDIFLSLAGATPTSGFTGVTASYIASPFVSLLWSTGETSTSIVVSQPGTYHVTASTADGCTASDTVQVSFGQPPVITLGATQTICQGDSVVLDPGPGFLTYQWLNGETTQTVTATAGGTYQVTVSSAPGCEASAFVSIIQLNEPIASFTFSNDNGLTVNFTAQVTGGATYNWDFNGDGTIDFTSNSPLTSHTYPAAGQYNVTLTVSNSCGNSTSNSNVNVIDVGIPNFSGINIKTFPNPAHDQLFIQMSELSNERLSFRIFDLQGRLVLASSETFSGVAITKSFDIAALKAGSYILEIASQSYRTNIVWLKH